MTLHTVTINRRTFLVTSGAAVASATMIVAATAVDGLVRTAGSEQLVESAPPALADLDTAYGTPTDLARRHTDPAWARTTDGRVMTYDRQTATWQQSPHRWTDVVTYGETVLVRWGQPSGRDQLVMVFGNPPPPDTTTTAATPTRSPTSTSSPAGTSTPPSAPAMATAPSTSAPKSTQIARPPSQATKSNSDLSYTGFPITPLAAAAMAALAAGAGLTFIARRRNQISETENTDSSTSSEQMGNEPGP